VAGWRARYGPTRIGTVLLAASVAVLWWSMPAAAQSSPLDEGPSSSGMPGAEFVRELVGWGKWLGLGACGLAMIYGAATWAGFGAASAGRAVQGKTYVLGGLIGAAVIGLVAVVVPLLYQAANG
jgi:hypothetical protein